MPHAESSTANSSPQCVGLDKWRNAIHHEDCVAGMANMPAESIDLIFADPPFNIGYEYDVYQDQLGREKYLEWSREWISAAYRALKSNGTFWLAIGDEYAAELKVLSQEIGFYPRSWVVWYYTFGVNCKYKFTRSHAHLFYFVKDPNDFTFRADDLENRIPSARELVYNDRRANPQGRLPDDTWMIRPANVVSDLIAADGRWTPAELAVQPDDSQTWTLRPQDIQDCFQESEDTWYFPRVAGTFKERQGFHGCQMPEQLLGRIIRCCSSAGEVVLDPFSGSATTLAVAKKLKRDFIGFELSEDYVTYGRSRLADIRVGDRLDGSAEPTKSAPATSTGRNGSDSRRKTQAAKRQQSLLEHEQRLEERQLEITLNVVAEAFLAVREGASVTLTILDPEINERFIDACRRCDISGDAQTWNALLLRLQGAGQFADLAISRSPDFSWKQADGFLHACEISLQRIIDEELAESVVEIFCDPCLAKRFDDEVARWKTESTVLETRWAAFMLERHAPTVRTRGALRTIPQKLGKIVSLHDVEPTSLPNDSALLLLHDRQRMVYSCETLNLRSKFEALVHSPPIQENASQFRVQFLRLQCESNEFLAWQSGCIRKHRPAWNYQRLGWIEPAE